MRRFKAGVAHLIDRERPLPSGGSTRALFFGRSDGEFSLRLSLSGRAVYTVPRTIVFHRVKKRGFRFVHQQIRNRWLLILVTYSWRSVVTLLPAFFIDECAVIASLMVQVSLRTAWQLIATSSGGCP